MAKSRRAPQHPFIAFSSAYQWKITGTARASAAEPCTLYKYIECMLLSQGVPLHQIAPAGKGKGIEMLGKQSIKLCIWWAMEDGIAASPARLAAAANPLCKLSIHLHYVTGLREKLSVDTKLQTCAHGRKNLHLHVVADRVPLRV